MLQFNDVLVACWEDLGVESLPEDQRWLNTPCCMVNPLLVINVPFGHIVFVGCGSCGRVIGGLAAARDAGLPDPKYLHPAGQTGMFDVKLPGSDVAPSVHFLEDRMAEVVLEETVVWSFKIATEDEVRVWKAEVGKGEL